MNYPRYLLVHEYKPLIKFLGYAWNTLDNYLIIIAIIVIVLLLQFLVGIFAIAPVGLEFVNSGTTIDTTLSIITGV